MLQDPRHRPNRLILAIFIGNAMEWFDIAINGFMAGNIATLFFPAPDPATSLLLTLGTFGVSFITRPIGSIVLGAWSDRYGRRRALTWSITLMTAATATVALTPDYAEAGVLAPVILVGARLVQGFSAGGEFGSSTAFLAEQDSRRRGLYTSVQASSQGLTTLLAAAATLALHAWLTPSQVLGWGWRLPFLFGMMVGPVGIYMRSVLREGTDCAAAAGTPARTTVPWDTRRVLVGTGLVAVATVGVYSVLFVPAFAVRRLGMPPGTGTTAVLLLGGAQMLLCPVFGHLSDRFGRLPIMACAAGAILVGIIPLLVLLVTVRSPATLFAVQVAVALGTAIYAGPMAAAMSELFPPATRSTGLAVGYSVGVGVFGGLSPLCTAALIGLTGSDLSPGYYIAGAAAISLLAIAYARRLGLR